jgi:hypothetical protein
MALRLYLSTAEQVGGFAGVPRQTQCFASPWGPPPYNGGVPAFDGWYHYNQIVGAGRNLPVFPFVTAQPTGSAVAVDWDIPVTLVKNPAGNTLNTLATPTLLGVFGLAANLTVNATDFIPGTNNPVQGQWSYEWYPNNDLSYEYARRNFENQYTLIPGVAYVWRPSTASLVGFLWCSLSQFGPGYPVWGMAPSMQFSTQYQGLTANDPDPAPGSYLWVNGGADFRRSAFNAGGQIITGYHQNVAALAGDVVVVEFWKINIHDVYSSNYLIGNMRGRQTIGGGTDPTMINGRNTQSAGYNYAFETTPTHNTFVDLPTLSPLTFPTEIPTPTYGPPAPAPNLIEINPRAGKGLGLVFDGPVGMTGPTIGGPVDGIGVPTATQTDTTHIDIDIDIPPVHPLGEATDVTPPADNVRHW